MKLIIQSFLFFLLFHSALTVQSQPAIEWQKSLGGSGLEYGTEIIEAKDGGFLVIGRSASTDIVDSTLSVPTFLSLHGFSPDMYAVKLSKSGEIEWQRLYGSFGEDFFTNGIQTIDGGFLLIGTNVGMDGDFADAPNIVDYCILKIDATGAIQWTRYYGGSQGDVPEGITQSRDGGYIISGFSYSFDGDVVGNHGANDAWVIKLNSIGELQWQKCLGGGDHDYSFQLIETLEGDIMVAGSTNSTDGDVFGTHGWNDYWLVKLNKYGDFQWQRCYGGSQRNELNDIVESNDGGFLLSGYSASTDGDVQNHILKYDYWIVKINSVGDIDWEKSYGGENDDGAKENVSDFSKVSIGKTEDGGYIIGGSTRSYAGDVSGNHGKSDYWLIRIDQDGNKLWQKCLGGSEDDFCGSVIQVSDGGYVVVGFSNSNDGDVTNHHGLSAQPDMWVAKLSPLSDTKAEVSIPIKAILYPNPNQGKFKLDVRNGTNGTQNSFQIEIYNLAGMLVYSSSDEKFENGMLNVDASVLPSGFYILHGIGENFIFSEKLTIY